MICKYALPLSTSPRIRANAILLNNPAKYDLMNTYFILSDSLSQASNLVISEITGTINRLTHAINIIGSHVLTKPL